MNIPSPLLLALLLLPLTAQALTLHAHLSGIKGEPLKNAKASLSLNDYATNGTKNGKPPLTTAIAKNLVLNGVREIQEALKPYGYYDATVSYNIKNDHTEKWQINYQVNPGKPIIITNLNIIISGDKENFPFATRDYNLVKGQLLYQPGYEKLKTYLATKANELGYFFAQFTKNEIAIDLLHHTATVDLAFTTGARAHFGELSFSDNPLSDRFLKRYAPFNTNEVFAQEQLSTLQSNLATNDNFNKVEIIADKKNFSATNQAVPIKVNLGIKKAINFTAGLGYGTDSGARTQVGLQWRRATRSGHSVSNNYYFSENSDAYRLGYHIPGSDPVNTNWTIAASYTADRSPERNIDTKQRQIELAYNKQAPASRLATHYRILYQEESYREIDDSTRARLFMPQAQWLYRSHSEGLFTPQYQVSLQLRGASNNLFSSTNFAQGLTDASINLKVREGLHSLWRGKFGITEQEEFSEIPPSLRFYAGGDRSVRGYAYQSLGPKKINNRGQTINIGGAYLLEGSTELDHHLWGKWSAAIFFDLGNAMDNWSDPLKQGAGIGLRWRTIIGIVRLDLASALSEDNQPWRIHFSIGPSF